MKSMRRVSRGRSFLGLMTYLLRRDAEHRQQPGVPIGGTVCGTTARDIARELRSAAQQRPDIIKPVWHQALRLPQGERLPPLTWCRIAEVFMEEMGFDTAQQPYAVVLHDDPQGQHIHIAASRVGMDGRIYLGQNENLRASRLVIELEKRFCLQRTPGPDAHVNQRRRPTRREQGMRQRTGEAVPREVLQDRIDAVLADGPVALDDFRDRLAADGISCLLNQSPGTGRICGISFSYGGLPFKGSQLGKAYAIAGLQKRGLSLVSLPVREDTSPAPEAAAMPAPTAMAEQLTTRPKTLVEAILGHPPPESLQKPAPRPADTAAQTAPLPQEEPFLPANEGSPPESPPAVSDNTEAEEETACEWRPRFGPG